MIVVESLENKVELRLGKASQETIEAATEQGLRVVYSYDYESPSLPQNITDMVEEDLMDLYAKYVSYLEFINVQAWCAKVDAADMAKEVGLEKARKKITMKEAKKAVAVIDSEIEMDPTYKQLVIERDRLDNYHGLVQLISEKTLKDISFINREISRRISANKATGRLAMFNP